MASGAAIPPLVPGVEGAGVVVEDEEASESIRGPTLAAASPLVKQQLMIHCIAAVTSVGLMGIALALILLAGREAGIVGRGAHTLLPFGFGLRVCRLGQLGFGMIDAPENMIPSPVGAPTGPTAARRQVVYLSSQSGRQAGHS